MVIAEFVFSGAERAPDKTALVHNSRTLSYLELARAIAAARRGFHDAGLGGEGVAIVAANSLLGFWVWSLALRDLGLTTVAARSIDHVAAGAGLAGVRAVVGGAGEAAPGLEAACERLGAPLIRGEVDAASSEPLEAPHRAVRPGGHILQTSGTTGDYKSVLMDPSFEAAFLRRRCEDYDIGPDALVGADDFGPWTGAGYKTAACVWLAGAAVLIHQGRDRSRPFARPDLTHAMMIPVVLSQALEALPAAHRRNDALQLYVGGGPMSQALADAARERLTPRLYSTIAATETSAFTQTLIETPSDRRWHRPIPGRGLEVVDEDDRPVPAGVIGRVRVLADGPTAYLNDEPATRRFFRGGYFYPGDLAVIRADGRMALHGRTTDVINVMGVKLSPAPVEDALRERLGVSEVCLFSMQDAAGEERLHVALETRTPPPADQIAAAISQEIRGFADAQVHFVTGMPRNGMGKVMRARLRGLLFPEAAAV